ncbi:unnamed protein product [Rotaria sp. Silwood2]|nr:unnamed protein product [Rotaria sp. Silwood2]CAF2771838.1 unnamed protein product [Rotaria sp. Silwood2]CAF2966146.1 unnamed protein product [Rotaria sp. Silwood2]CAF4432593.1 unnamed protein product [Rotaria sp. Silwood2]CAF4545371.1 unnamed protein product [Rotaria sp. Silwood2]
MDFDTSQYSDDLDNYVRNIYRSCSTTVFISNSSTSHPKRIRKRKRLYTEETESIIKPKRSHRNPSPILLTDTEREQQFGERLSPTIKSEHNDEIQKTFIIETESISQKPIERARTKFLY